MQYQRFPRSLPWFSALVFVFLAASSAVSAQITTAAIHGTITDQSGAVVPNAQVSALNTATGITTTTTSDKAGSFVFPELQVGGPYTVTVSDSGFESFVATGLTLNVNDDREVLASLKVGGGAQTVEVTATALQVETSNTQLQQIVTASQLESVPLEGRDAGGLQKFEAGSVESADRFGTYSSNGNQTAQNDTILNGTDINDGPLQVEGITVNPDALEEENIVTSTMNPEFSRNSGAVINQVMKSGTNSFHGSGFEFYRDSFMNNGNYFSQTRPDFHQNLYGGTLGGPIFKNKLFFFAAYQGLRNRTAQTEVANTFTGTKGSSPTEQFAGNFTSDLNYYSGGENSSGLTNNPIPFNIGSCVADPDSATPETWADCFSSGTVVIPPSQWNSVSAKLVNTYVPQSNYGPALYNFNAPNTEAEDQGILRADYTPSAKDSIWASTVFQSSPSAGALSFAGGSFPGFGAHAAEHFKIFSASYTHTFSANLLNELRGGYYRFNNPGVIPTPIQSPSSLGFSINPQLSDSGIPYISVGSDFVLGNSYAGPQSRTDTNLTYADNFTWIKGNHSFKFGGSYEQFRVHNPYGYLNNGYYSYYGGGFYSSGDPLIDFVMGIPDSYYQSNDGFIDVLASEAYAYAQDNWRLSTNLTVNYGVAWDVEQPTQNLQYDGLGIVCYQLGNVTSKVYPDGPPGLTFNGDPGCNKAGGPTTHFNRFGPRVGFAWSPSAGPAALIGAPGTHSFSVRAGFGIYYNRDQEEQSLQNLTDPPNLYISLGAADFGGSPAFANPFADVAGNGSETNPFPFAALKPGAAVDWDIYSELELATFDRNYTVPYTYNFNLNIQRQLGSHYLAQVGYVGSVSHRLATWSEGDPITPAGHAACLANPSCAGLPGYIHLYFPQYTAQPATVGGSAVPWYLSVGDQTTEGSSNYNSLQATLIKAMDRGLQFSIAYTYSHALDDGSGYESTTGGQQDAAYGNYGRVRNYVPGYEYLNYGSSDFDARQRLAVTYVYSLPAVGFLKKNALLREGLGGWGLSGVTALQSGFPISVSTGSDRSLWCDSGSKFGCGDVPNTSSFNIARYNPRSSPATHQYFNTSPFSLEAIGTFGNTTRNFFHGPGFNYTNLSLTKDIHFSADGMRYLQLRLEGFNVFNHANFQAPSGVFENPTFGQVTGVISSAEANRDPSPGRAVQLAGKVYF